MIHNQEVAALLEKVADILEVKGESAYRSGAYRHAARHIATTPEDIVAIWVLRWRLTALQRR